MDGDLNIHCPCCATRLVVDRATGEILSEERPKADHARDFDEALKDFKGGAKRREDAFSKAFDKTQKLDDLLDKKFEEAKKKAAKDDSKPFNPFDMD